MNACFIIAVWCARPACASGVHVTFATCCEMSRIGMHIALCRVHVTGAAPLAWALTRTAGSAGRSFESFIWSSIRSILYCTEVYTLYCTVP